jgi:DNA-binding transcriptional LysR family regulator
LFRREGRGIVATLAGQALAASTSASIEGLESTLDAFRMSSSGTGILRVGGPSDLIGARAAAALAPMIAKGTQVRFELGLAGPLVSLLAADELDLVIATTRVPARGVESEPLFTEELVFVAARRWKLDSESEAIPLIGYADTLPLIRRFWRQAFAAAPPRNASIVLPDLRAILELVLAGVGASVLPHYLVSDPLANGLLVELAPQSRRPTNTISLAWRTAARAHPRNRAARELLHAGAATW